MATSEPLSLFGLDSPAARATSAYDATNEGSFFGQHKEKSGSWTWRDTEVVALSKALSINLPLYAKAAKKRPSKSTLKAPADPQADVSSCQGQPELSSRQLSGRFAEVAQDSGRTARGSPASDSAVNHHHHIHHHLHGRRNSRAESDPGLSKMGLGKTVIQAYRDSKGSIKNKLTSLLSRTDRSRGLSLGSKSKVHPMSPPPLEPEPDVRPHNLDYLAYFGGAAEEQDDVEEDAIDSKATAANAVSAPVDQPTCMPVSP